MMEIIATKKRQQQKQQARRWQESNRRHRGEVQKVLPIAPLAKSYELDHTSKLILLI